MIPFLYFDLKAVIRNLLDIVIESVVIGACCSVIKNQLWLFLLRKKLIPLQSLMLPRFKRLTNSEKVQDILSLKCGTSCLKEAR